MIDAVNIELLVVTDCPHRAVAEHLLRTALVDVGLPADFSVVTVTDTSRRDFSGSPTFCADGLDLFPAVAKASGLTCRIYRSGSGLSGLPDLPTLRQALKRHADRGS
jgi:hypothetical protein